MPAHSLAALRRIEDEERRRFLADGGSDFDLEDETEARFVLMPPPNITGPLHVGHGISLTLQDAMVRHWRLQGHRVYFPPGLDHAGSRLENAVRKRMRERGQDPRELDRAAFLTHLKAWVAEHTDIIYDEMKRLSIATNWDHAWFSMDEERTRVVRDTFVALYERGLIYRASAVTNWCPELGMAIPGDGIDVREDDGLLYHIALATPAGQMELAVQRPEALLAASAVGVRAEHPLSSALIGAEVRLPIVGRAVPVLECGPRAGMDSARAVLLVPSVSGLDYEYAQQHDLPVLELYGADGCIAGEHPFSGLEVERCREQLVAELRGQGLITATTPTRVQWAAPLGFGQVPILPRVTEQWYLSVQRLSEDTLGHLQNTPVRFNARKWQHGYRYWLRRYQQSKHMEQTLWWDGADLRTTRGYSNNRDWILSSQAAWGQRLPVWHCRACARPNVSRTAVSACGECGSEQLDETLDVVQLIFSCAMWPKSVGRWPERAVMTDLTVTGHDVYLYWIATSNMIFGEIEGTLAYGRVHVHGLVTDEHGAKMTKSNGNIVALTELLDQEGTEVTRASFFHALAGKEGEPWLVFDAATVERGRRGVEALFDVLSGADISTSAPAQSPALDELEAAVDDDMNAGRVGGAYVRVLDHLAQLRTPTEVSAETLRRYLVLLHRFHPLLSDHLYRARLRGEATLLLQRPASPPRSAR
ncbi:class I tRNA ligase family protein [Haliangium sp.]|uniref:class I tRNA ligase family protein n=1 Tax=Haliangium sp. TaxID=2663208 RepID=UPI003D14D4C3